MVEPQHLRCIIIYSYSSDVGFVGGATTFFFLFWSRRQSCRRGAASTSPPPPWSALDSARTIRARVLCHIIRRAGQAAVARFLQWISRICPVEKEQDANAGRPRLYVGPRHACVVSSLVKIHACLFFSFLPPDATSAASSPCRCPSWRPSSV